MNSNSPETEICVPAGGREAEQSLSENEEFTSSLLNHTPNPLFVIFPDRAIKYVNPAFEKLTGFSPTDVIGIKPPYPWWPEETKEEIDAFVKQIPFDSDEKTEMAFRKRNGEHFWVEVSATAIENKGGRRYTLVNWVDITERKRLEDKLIKEQQEIRTIIDSSPLLIFYKDKEGQLLRVNKAFAEALNMPEKYFLGKTVFDLYSAEIAQGMNRDDREVLKSGRPKLNIIEQYESATGLRWVQTDKVPIIDDNGTPIGLIGFAQDITERKQTEKALRESEEKFSLAFNASPGIMTIVTPDGRYIEVSDSFSRITGYTREEVIGRRSRELNIWGTPDERTRFIEKIKGERFRP